MGGCSGSGRCRSRRRRRPAGARVGGAQGRRPLLRRRLRDRAADAGGRGEPVPLAHLRAVPERRRARPDHPGPGRPYGRRGWLRSTRARRWAPRSARRVHPVIRVRAARSGRVPASPRQRAGASVPRRRGPGRRGGDPRNRCTARSRPVRDVAVRGARRRAVVLLLVLRRGVVPTLLVAGAIGVVSPWPAAAFRTERRPGTVPAHVPTGPRRGTVPRRVSAGDGRSGPPG